MQRCPSPHNLWIGTTSVQFVTSVSSQVLRWSPDLLKLPNCLLLHLGVLQNNSNPLSNWWAFKYMKTALISTFSVFSKLAVPVPSIVDSQGQASWPLPPGTGLSLSGCLGRVIAGMKHQPPAVSDPRLNRSPLSHCPALYNHLFRGWIPHLI